jgi:hypothetical protein
MQPLYGGVHPLQDGELHAGCREGVLRSASTSAPAARPAPGTSCASASHTLAASAASSGTT